VDAKDDDKPTERSKAAIQIEMLGAALNFPTKSMCRATKLWLVEGRKYRIRLDMDEGPDSEWFDNVRLRPASSSST